MYGYRMRSTEGVRMSQHRPILKGSDGHIYQFLMEEIRANDASRCTLSIYALSDLTGYCPRTVKAAIKRLVERNVIRVEKSYGERRNTYLAGGQ
jgi:DNA-binding MarR family transcriptional regulator